MEKFMEKFNEFIKNQSFRLISSVSIVLITLLLIIILRIIINRFIRRNKRKRATTLARLIQSIIRYILVIAMIIGVLSVWGVNVGPIIAGAGIVGVALGFGAQTLIKDILAGISIVFENYYDIDDVVEIKGYKGKVTEIGLRSTRLENWKGEVKIFSNGDITEVTNFSKNPTLGVIEIDVAYRENVDKVIALLDEKISTIKDMFPQIIEGPNVIGVIKLGTGGVTIRITVKTQSEEHYAVERGIYKYLKELFEENNIEIPYNRTVVYNDKYSNKL